MKIFNKFIWSKKEPSNKNDIWFDGSTWKMYTEEAWQSFTLPVDAADKVAKVIEDISEVYQEKLNAGYGIVIEGNTISVDDSIKYDDNNVWEAIETLQQTKVEQTQLNDYVPWGRYESTSQMLIETMGELSSTKADKAKTEQELNKKLNKTDVATINGQSLIEGGNIVIDDISKIILDFEKLGEPIESSEDGMEMRYSKEQFENAVGMSMSEFIEKIKTSELVLNIGAGGMNPYYVVVDEYTWAGYYKMVGLFTYALVVDTTPSEEKFFVSIYDESVDLPFATTEYVDEKHAQTETKLTELSEEMESNGQLIEDLQNMKIDRENDDYYPKMAVGLADNLSGVDVVDSEVNFRRSGGGAISDGVARIETIKGNSVVWNQLIPRTYKTTTHNGVTFTVNEDGSVVANGTASATAYIVIKNNFLTDASHKYAVFGTPSGGSPTTFYFGNGNAINDKEGNGSIMNGQGSTSTFACRVQSGNTVTNAVFRPCLIDLTQMFGSGNEPTTIEEFYARIPMGVDLNAYNEGEVIHMDVQSVESQGANAWDEEWEKGRLNTTDGSNVAADNTMRMKNSIKVLPNANYYCKSPVDVWVLFLDTNGEVIEGYSTGLEKYQNACRVKNSSFVTPSNAAYIRAYFNQYFTSTTTYNHDICINISDTSINGKYFPYIKRVEDLSIIRKYFPQGMKSAGTAHDEIRYNKASGKKEYSKGRLKAVDMGTLNWTLSSTYPSLFYAKIADIRPSSSNGVAGNILTSKYVTLVRDNIHDYDKSCALDNVYNVFVKDSAYTDAASFKASLQGVILYYEPNDWEWVELDEADQYKDFDIQVWNGGTEKANAEGKSAPLAADITYGFNAIGKIKELESLVAALRAKVGI